MSGPQSFDHVIANGLVFDGRGGDPVLRHLGIRDGRIASISETPLAGQSTQVLDANGRWVMPGFVDLHTHYDAELEVSPSVGRSALAVSPSAQG